MVLRWRHLAHVGLDPILKALVQKNKEGVSDLACVFGRRQDAVFLELQTLLEPFGITRFYTDGWGAYERHIAPEQHPVGKQHTQKIESKHINVRTRIKRLVRHTICFSQTATMHDVVIGLFIHHYACGLLI